MNKILRYSFVVLMAIIGMNVSAQEVTLDFTSADNPWNLPTDYDKTEKSYMNGDVVITFNASTTGHKINTKDGYLIFGKEGATLTMTGFRFDVERIDIIGRSGASGSVKQNIFVGEEAVSTETTGATGTNIYKIAESHQGAGNVYTLKVLSAHNTQITKILIWKKGTAGDAPEPTHIENTEETAYTVAKAFELIDAGEALSETVFVKGIVSQVDSYNETYKSITYWISDDGTTDRQLQVYSGKGLEGADFASIDDVKVGAKVIIKGNIKKYNTIYEFDKNNQLVRYEVPTEDTWTVAGTLPLTDKEWDPTDTNGDMLPNGNGAGVSSYERDNIVLEAGKNYECKVVKNHSWDNGSYPESNYVIKVDETAKYHVKIFFNTTTHEVFHEIAKMGEAGPITHTWSVTGTLVGGWDIDVDMIKGEDGLYKAEIENVAAGTYKFKVRADKLWTTSYPANDYELTVEKDGSNVTVTFDEAKEEVKAIVSMPISQNIVWSFTSWSKSTVSALIADAAASKTEGWSDVEKAADAEAGADPTEAAKNNCFWFAGRVNEDGSLSANGVVIKELQGLKFNSDYAAKRSLAIAVNYPTTSLGDYAGPSYLWLGGGGSKQTFPCFTIPGVKAGSKITFELESHKPSDARGIGLYKNSYAEENLIGEQFKPTAKEAKTWEIAEDCDVVVWNTSGCHIYTIKVEAGSTGISTVKAQKTQNNVIYNLAGQKVGNDYKGIVIMNGKKFMQK